MDLETLTRQPFLSLEQREHGFFSFLSLNTTFAILVFSITKSMLFFLQKILMVLDPYLGLSLHE